VAAAPRRTDGSPARARTTLGKRPAAPKAPAKPTRGPYASEPKFLEEQRTALLEEREVYKRQAEDLRAEAESLALEREPGDVQFDEESGEGGTVAVDRERDLTLSAQALATIEEIDMALRAIDALTYGACEICGQPIPKARLRALPYARLCVSCKSGGLHRR
jgi:DnaK suppressor protein